jgi:integrase
MTRRRQNGGRAANGRSSIYRGSDGRWHGWVTMGVKDDGSPDRRHVTGKTEKVVTAKVRDLEKQRDSGHVAKAGRAPTVTAWLRHYLDTIAAPRVRPRTLNGYRGKIEQHAIPGLGRHRIDRLTPEHIEALYAKLEREGLSRSSIAQLHRILSRAFKVAAQRSKIARNPFTLVSPPSVPRYEAEALTQEEARRLLEAARGRRNAARWSVALALGLRQGEALGLQWRYIDLERGTLRVAWELARLPWQHGCEDPHACGWRKDVKGRPRHRAKPCPASCRRHMRACPPPCPKDCVGHASSCPGRKSGGLALEEPKSTTSRRTIALPSPLVAELRAQRRQQREDRLAAGSAWEMWNGHSLVFTQPNGHPVDPRQDWAEWKHLLRDARVRNVRVHDGRHTAATLLLEHGIPIRVVADVLGHSSIQLTGNTYQHVTQRLNEVAASAMSTALWPTSSPGIMKDDLR